jgi:hypothetical protein
MHVYPTPGLLVRDPVKRDFLPEEGRAVDDSDFYWLRRLGCNDATLTKPATNQTVAVAEAKAIKSTPSDGSDSQ